ncbi:Hsp70 family protein [Roseobacter sinensis]|uniref:Hsp70 family protein n=1 Tax=Roseobacter sinensis TaxID=2931391 RepID=A0ABT3BH08_9RHOB|nr:Hsp70 family protein [Roseobacter sp. WL0113]MCV3272825.1 Hsp70 family protein [Roseobacter sp. WL0113]
MPQGQTLAIDFGTSNSAAALMHAGAVHRIPIEDGQPTLPTAVFFPAEDGPMQIGTAAIEALIAGEDGRFMRALKSVLGLPLFHEQRLISGRRRSLLEITAAFLERLRRAAEDHTGQRFTHVLSGRPVHFHAVSDDKEAQAEDDLRASYHAAGFAEVSFLAEPEAAALTTAQARKEADIELVVDIGGGTSDFTVVQQSAAGPVVLASHGLRLGGTDFDHAISMSHAMPCLGLGTQLRREMGDGLLPVPIAPFADLATWAKIPFLYTPETRRMVARMLRLSTQPDRLGRLAQVLEQELGHDIAFAVEAGKIAVNGAEGEAVIDLRIVETGLDIAATRPSVDAALTVHKHKLSEAVATTLTRAGIEGADVHQVTLVGGSSLMSLVSDVVALRCPQARIARAEAFTAVVDGLAHAAHARDRAAAT